jgi:hypothetical protein
MIESEIDYSVYFHLQLWVIKLFKIVASYCLLRHISRLEMKNTGLNKWCICRHSYLYSPFTLLSHKFLFSLFFFFISFAVSQCLSFSLYISLFVSKWVRSDIQVWKCQYGLLNGPHEEYRQNLAKLLISGQQPALPSWNTNSYYSSTFLYLYEGILCIVRLANKSLEMRILDLRPARYYYVLYLIFFSLSSSCILNMLQERLYMKTSVKCNCTCKIKP